MLLIAIAFISIVSYQYRGLGFVLNATTGLSVETCTIICTVVVIALAFSGGLKTVAVTDAMSAFLMIGGMLVALPLLLKTVGGFLKALPSSLIVFQLWHKNSALCLPIV